MSEFIIVITSDSYFFTIESEVYDAIPEYQKKAFFYGSYDGEYSNLGIYTDIRTCALLAIACFRKRNAMEMSALNDSYEFDDLKVKLKASFITPKGVGRDTYGFIDDFTVYFSKEVLLLIIDDGEPYYCYENDRIKIYYDNDYTLLQILIKDLTEEEYEALKSKTDPPLRLTPERSTDLMQVDLETGVGWTLDDEGTLLVTDTARVDGMCAPEVKEKTRRIVVKDCYVPQRLFEGFQNCYEAIIDCGMNAYWVDDYAFAHCHSLYWLVDKDGNTFNRAWDFSLSCAYPEDCSPHTLLDTPLQTYYDHDVLPDFDTLEKDWLLDAKPRSCLTEGLWGKRFAGLLLAELILMGLLKVPEYGPGNFVHDPVADEWMWFRGCMRALRRGVEAKEPAMLYLAAQCARRAGHRRRENMRMDGMDVFEEKDALDLYTAAARAGSPQALLWCAFCMEDGRYGMQTDSSTSREFLEAVRRTQAEDAQSSPVPLWFGELDVMRERYYHLNDEVLYGSDLEEDRLYTYCKDDDEYNRKYWNPSWHTNSIRKCHIIDFALDLGVPFVSDLWFIGYPETYSHPRRKCYKYDRGDDGLREAKAALHEEWNEWSAWCRSKGIPLLDMQTG